MLSDFINENLPTVDYKLKVQLFNPVEPEQEHIEIVAAYRTPNRSYVKTSARDLNAEDVDLDVLAYIIEHCHQCTELQKYEAAIVALHKFYQKSNNVALANKLKQKIMDSFDYSEASNSSNFEWADQYSDGTQKIFYVLQIVIGKNKLVKIGITSDRLRQRLAVLKSDINHNYTKKALYIEPLLIIDCVDNTLFEKDVKTLILESGCVPAKYNFRGSSEMFSAKHKDVIMNIAIDVAERSNADILFNTKNDGSGSNQQVTTPTSQRFMPKSLI
jgi:hypothetical protein